MAKKKKQKKTGLLKRQKTKQDKKRLLKKKTKANKPTTKKMSPSKLKRSIKQMPSLIFEPELREIAFTQEQVEEARDKHAKEPDQIEAVADSEFVGKLSEQIGKMKIRFDEEKDVDKGVMVYTLDYFMNETKAPAFLNHIIVAMYYEALSRIKEPETPLDTAALNLLIQRYESTWESYIQEKLECLQNLESGDAATDTDALDNDDGDFSLSLPFEPLIEEFAEYLKLDEGLDEDSTERAEDDVGALLNDYLEEKGVDKLEDLTPRKVKSFLDGWFARVMHPTDEDMIFMLDSLEKFFKFAHVKEKIPAEKAEEFLKIFQERKNVE